MAAIGSLCCGGMDVWVLEGGAEFQVAVSGKYVVHTRIHRLITQDITLLDSLEHYITEIPFGVHI